jgi:hypothetical protein
VGAAAREPQNRRSVSGENRRGGLEQLDARCASRLE